VEEINRDSGTTIMLTTHDLADVERLCKRIIFISQGTVLYDGAVTELKRRYAPYRHLEVTLVPASDGDGADPMQFVVPGAEVIEQDVARLVIRFDPEAVAVADLISAVIARHQVSDISIVEPDLEGVVRQIVEHGGMP
jgi:ABC-2 type transport system ATP-binding protein